MEINIRQGQQSDREFIYRSLCFMEERQLDENSFIHLFKEFIENENSCILIGEHETTPVGFVISQSRIVLHFTSPVLSIEEFYVARSHRYTTAAYDLLQALDEWVLSKDYPFIEIICDKKNTLLKGWLEKTGFRSKELLYKKLSR